MKGNSQFTSVTHQDERASILRAAIKAISLFPCFWEIFNYSDVG